MPELQQGGNAPVAGSTATVTLDWQAPAGMEIDGSAYLLAENGKVRGDQDMIFFNQTAGGDGAVNYAKSGGAGGSESAAMWSTASVTMPSTFQPANSPMRAASFGV